MDQLSIWDYLTELEDEIPSEETSQDYLTVDDLHHIRDSLLVTTCRRAFGVTRNGRGTPSDEAWQWILSDEKKLPFSFDHCCAEFGADPETAKEILLLKFKKMFGS